MKRLYFKLIFYSQYMRGLQLNHDQKSNITSRSILNKWRSGEDLNNFVNDDVAFVNSTQNFPSPDQSFYSESKKTLVAMEFYLK